MTANVVSLRRPAQIACSGCGAVADAPCDCGVAYLPAGTRAAQAIAASPEKSDRAIAAELGIGHATVSRARGPTVSGEPVEPRIGLDGKVRRLPQRRTEAEEAGPEDEIEDPANYRTAFLIRVDQALRFAVYSGPITKELIAAARRVGAAWMQLADKMEGSNG